jgi:hypothetical protein
VYPYWLSATTVTPLSWAQAPRSARLPARGRIPLFARADGRVARRRPWPGPPLAPAAARRPHFSTMTSRPGASFRLYSSHPSSAWTCSIVSLITSIRNKQ